MENVKLILPSKPDYVGVARLTTSAIANNIGLNIEEIEDMKVVIAEACTNALGKDDKLYINYQIEKDKLTTEVKDVSEDVGENEKEKELGILIIKSLMDQVIFSEEGIKMIKNIEDGINE